MLIQLIVLCLYCHSETLLAGVTANITSTFYLDELNFAPLGCNETSMWTTLRRSKLSCAASCLANKTCVVFTYSSVTNKCLVCHGDLIQNLTFISDKVYSWPYQTAKTNLPVIQDNFSPVSNGIYSGFVVHLTGYFFGYNNSYFAIRLSQDDDSEGNNIPLVVRFYKSSVEILYVQNTNWKSVKKVTLPAGTIQANTNTTVAVMMIKDGYQIYANQIYCCSTGHVMDFQMIHYVGVIMDIQVYQLSY
ncbi:hypothetical protein BgiMline_032653 [Biomphalaria glabrata]|nr:hypothetical protein BgiMline_015666 [Biomphalaria glabrata]